jgi:hypothetical protein
MKQDCFKALSVKATDSLLQINFVVMIPCMLQLAEIKEFFLNCGV